MDEDGVGMIIIEIVLVSVDDDFGFVCIMVMDCGVGIFVEM